MKLYISLSSFGSTSVSVYRTPARTAAAVRTNPKIAEAIKRKRKDIDTIHRQGVGKYRAYKRKQEADKIRKDRERKAKARNRSTSSIEEDYSDGDFTAVMEAIDYSKKPIVRKRKKRKKVRLTSMQKRLRALVQGAMGTFPELAKKVKRKKKDIERLQDTAWREYVKQINIRLREEEKNKKDSEPSATKNKNSP